MLTALTKNGRVYAWQSKKADGPFICPGCRWPAILKEGLFVAAHFAHEPGADCPYANYHQGESEVHYGAKIDIFNALSTCPGVTDLKLERYMGPVRPDISFRLNGTPIAIEMQHSSINSRVIERRTREYTRRGIYILWVSPWKDIEAGKLQDTHLYDPPAWERYIHFALNQGRFYYWMKECTILPVHFEEAEPGYTHDPLLIMKQAMVYAHFEEEQQITDLTPFSVSVRYSEGELLPHEAKLFAVPTIWLARDDDWVSPAEAYKRYPATFLDPAHLALHAEPFVGDPFEEGPPADPSEMLELPPEAPKKCPIHNRLYRYADSFGNFYCNDPVCWSRYRLLLLGEEHSYPEVIAVVDRRDYLPDLTAQPIYRPSPYPDSPNMVAIYPPLLPRTKRLIEAGEDKWRIFSSLAHYENIALALKTIGEWEH